MTIGPGVEVAVTLGTASRGDCRGHQANNGGDLEMLRSSGGALLIGFNTFLRTVDIEPKIVKLVRHQTKPPPGRPTPYQLWRAGRMEEYQSVQGRPVFKDAEIVATFVASPFGETLFVGLYGVNGNGIAPPGTIDPLTGHDCAGHHFYDLSPLSKLTEYVGRMIIDWGSGSRSWVQLASRSDKPILEIRRTAFEEPFPGFLDFSKQLSDFAHVPQSWRTTLSAVSGVYLLIHPETGKQYVGIAHGAGGFWQRWEGYVASGHGGNRRMMDLPAANYHVSILEIASSTATLQSLQDAEVRWKTKIMSRKFGLNGN